MPLIDLANPSRFLTLSGRLLPWLGAATCRRLRDSAIYLAMQAPDDYQQGATVKIMFIHVPSAWLSMFIWGTMSIAALGTLVWRHPLADVAAKAAAPIGAAFTLQCLITGSLWGRPMWGTYWVWDGRLTSVLVLFLMYLGVHRALAHGRGSRAVPRARRRCSRWSAPSTCRSSNSRSTGGRTLHQPASVCGSAGRPSIRPSWSAAGDGARVPAAVPDAASRRHAQRDHAAARPHADDDAGGARRPGTERDESWSARSFHRRRLLGRRPDHRRIDRLDCHRQPTPEARSSSISKRAA